MFVRNPGQEEAFIKARFLSSLEEEMGVPRWIGANQTRVMGKNVTPFYPRCLMIMLV